jgi:hypothetical protein
MHAKFWLGSLKDHCEDLEDIVKITLKWILIESDGRVWTGLNWRRIGWGAMAGFMNTLLNVISIK